MRPFKALLARHAPPDWRRQLPILLLVVLPGLLATLYFGLIASKQYVSETKFVIRRAESSAPRPTGLAEIFSAGGALGSGENEARLVHEYLRSYDAIDALTARKIDLVSMFRRAGTDPISRLYSKQPSAEVMRQYFRQKIHVLFDTQSGLSTIQVFAFRPKDAELLARNLLILGESKVNELNDRAHQIGVASAQQEVKDSEAELTDVQNAVTRFRNTKADINPNSTIQGRQVLVAQLEAQMAAMRTQLSATKSAIAQGSPQGDALQGQIKALENQIAYEKARLTGAAQSSASNLSTYEGLQLRQQFAASRLQAARLALENARQQAARQTLFIVPVVKPHLPEKSTAPNRLALIATTLLSLLLAYGIGWLIVAGIKEHAA